MESYEGTVSGIDVQATSGQPIRCQAFISKLADDSGGEFQVAIQVAAYEHQLQTALESASARGVRVEVTFEPGDDNRLVRVRLLDRD